MNQFWKLAVTTYLAALGQSAKTVAEVWGEEAVPKNCFEVIPAVGSVENGQKESNWIQL